MAAITAELCLCVCVNIYYAHVNSRCFFALSIADRIATVRLCEYMFAERARERSLSHYILRPPGQTPHCPIPHTHTHIAKRQTEIDTLPHTKIIKCDCAPVTYQTRE